jgi:molybdopterin synthase sulfur carrier subunit
MTRLLYFAWVREKIGMAEEEVALPESVATVGDLVDWLRGRGANYADAFASRETVRAAIDRRHARPDADIAGAREIAFFPPVTGG